MEKNLIPQHVIDNVKKSIDIITYIQNSGVELKKTGKEYRGLCPFHKDTNPSFYVNKAKGVYKCHGCNKSGDVIQYVVDKENVSFPEAVKRLSNGKAVSSIESTSNTISPTTTEIPRSELLSRAFQYFEMAFRRDMRGLEYLQAERKITAKQLYQDFRMGFANGSLSSSPLTDAVKVQLRQVGVLNKNNKELFHECVVFPLYDQNGHIVNLYGRHITRDQHLYLPGERCGLFYSPTGCESVIITESIIDALTLKGHDYHNVLAIYGVNGLTYDHLEFLKARRIRKATLCLDNDEAGHEAVPRLVEKLQRIGLETSELWLPDGFDINDFFKQFTKADFEKLLRLSQKAVPIISSAKQSISSAPERKDTTNTATNQAEYAKQCDEFSVKEKEIDSDLYYEFNERTYRVSGLKGHGLERLKVTLKVSCGELFFLDSFDLYVSRARDQFISRTSNLLSVEEGVLIREMHVLIDRLEKKRTELLKRKDEKSEQKIEMTAEERKEAMKFLKSKDMVKRILSDFEKCGLIAEDSTKLFGYIAMISRFMEKPLGVLIIARSGSGKSATQDAIVSFVAPEDLQKFTRLTGQTLFYKGKTELKHKVLAIAEEEGITDALYSIRTLASDQYLAVSLTITDPQTGKKGSEENRTEGPVAIFITTTNPDAMDFETRNRFMIQTIDESRKQTRRIFCQQRKDETLEGMLCKSEQDKILEIHHNAQRLLRRHVKVVNPYAPQLTFPSEKLLTRRSHKAYLTLIKTIAFLKQYQRPLKKAKNSYGETFEYIEVNLDDIELANKLAGQILGRSLDELSPHTRSLLNSIKQMVDERSKQTGRAMNEIRFTRQEICDYTHLTYWQVRVHLDQLQKLEYLLQSSGSQGKRCQYELLWQGEGQEGEKFMMGLVDVEKLRQQGKKH